MKIVLEIASGVMVLEAFILLIWKVLINAGINLKKRIDKDVQREKYEPSKKECLKVFGGSLIFRIAIIIIGFMIYCIFRETANHADFSKISEIWNIWDAQHYIRISDSYTAYMHEGDFVTLVFFPLYPLFLKIANIVIQNAEISGLVVSALTTSLACVYMYKLVCMDYGKNIAGKALKLMNIVPFGFFFGAIMSEGTFLLTSIMTLYYIRKHSWAKAGIAGMLAALSRSVRSIPNISSNNRIYRRIQIARKFKRYKTKNNVNNKKMVLDAFITDRNLYIFIYKLQNNR